MTRSIAAVAATALAFSALAIAALPASAADAVYVPPPVIAPPPAPPAPTWEGFYLGGHAGYAQATREGCLNSFFFGPDLCQPVAFLPILFSFDQEGYLLGGQAGYNLGLGGGNIILGLEVSASLADIEGSLFPSATGTWNWLASATARLGWGGDRFLVYGEGGLALAEYTFDAGILCDFTSTATGWTAGGGAELKVGASGNASIFAEYAYYSFPDHVNTCGGLGGLFLVGTDVDASMHTVKVGFNYRFNGL
jgi:outer membrane immunogenic protein